MASSGRTVFYVMHILIQPRRFRAVPGPVVLAAGFFDGVHRGHRLVLGGAMREARRLGGQAWALTFDQHPLSILAPERRPPLLTPLEVRLERLAATGMDGCLVLPFTKELAALPPERFLAQLCGHTSHVVQIRCGSNWRFGARAAGDVAELRRQGAALGFRVSVARAATCQGKPVSSTRIREAIQHGRLADATAMLGRPYSIRETVVRGRGVGRVLGMATANVHPAAEVLPPIGVYAVITWIGDRPVQGVASLGFRPTFADARPETPILETHFLDFAGDLYGATLDISFLARLRPERKYPSADALMAQVRRDIAAARRIFARAHGS
jgi:riboflavin kinase/FMN adenylyltransferase